MILPKAEMHQTYGALHLNVSAQETSQPRLHSGGTQEATSLKQPKHGLNTIGIVGHVKAMQTRASGNQDQQHAHLPLKQRAQPQ